MGSLGSRGIARSRRTGVRKRGVSDFKPGDIVIVTDTHERKGRRGRVLQTYLDSKGTPMAYMLDIDHEGWTLNIPASSLKRDEFLTAVAEAKKIQT